MNVTIYRQKNNPTENTQPLHTPIPWRALLSAGDASIYGPDINAVAKVIRGNKTGYEQKANIELIVRAVNTHAANEAKIAALFKALEDAENQMRGLAGHLADHVNSSPQLLMKTLSDGAKASADNSRAALALARI